MVRYLCELPMDRRVDPSAADNRAVRWVTWTWFGTCASCRRVEVWTHLRFPTTLFTALQSKATWVWFGTCARCVPIEVSTHQLVATTLLQGRQRMVT